MSTTKTKTVTKLVKDIKPSDMLRKDNGDIVGVRYTTAARARNYRIAILEDGTQLPLGHQGNPIVVHVRVEEV